MRRRMARKLLPAFVFLLLLCPEFALGQRAIGIKWHVPDQSKKAEAQLEKFKHLGIIYLQIDQPLGQHLWGEIEEGGFTVYGQLPFQFPVPHTFMGGGMLRGTTNDLLNQFKRQPSVAAIGLFCYGDESDRRFTNAAKKFASALKTRTSKPLYYTTSRPAPTRLDSLFSFKMASISSAERIKNATKVEAIFFRPPAGSKWSLAPLKKIFQETAQRPNQPIFFDSIWLQKVLDKHPQFAQTLSLQTHAAEPIFPLPQQHYKTAPAGSLITLMLLLLWIIFAVTYNFNPIYRKSFLRYFTGHSFFVGDVMKRHIRNFFIGFSILLQHCISGGIILYCFFYTAFTPLGQQALAAHYPIVALFGMGKLAFFAWGALLTLFTELGMVLWLWLVNPRPNAIDQIMNLYPWPLQLNLITATLSAVVVLPAGNPLLIYLTGILFLLVFNSGFITTCFDMMPYSPVKPHWYLGGTVGLYLIFLAAITGWILASPVLGDVVDLAFSLS